MNLSIFLDDKMAIIINPTTSMLNTKINQKRL